MSSIIVSVDSSEQTYENKSMRISFRTQYDDDGVYSDTYVKNKEKIKGWVAHSPQKLKTDFEVISIDVVFIKFYDGLNCHVYDFYFAKKKSKKYIFNIKITKGKKYPIITINGGRPFERVRTDRYPLLTNCFFPLF
jgi:hypothetical protein